MILKDSKAFAALRVPEWFSFTAHSGIISFVVEQGSWMFYLAGREERGARQCEKGENLGRQNLVPQLEFPQDTESNCATIEGAKGPFTSCFGFGFPLKSLKKVMGKRQLEKHLTDLVSVFLWNYCALQLLLLYTDGYCWFPSVR